MPDGKLVRYLAPAALVIAALAILITWRSSVTSEAPPEPAARDQPAETTEEVGGEEGGDEGGSEEGSGEEGSGDPQTDGDPQAAEDAEGEGEGEGEVYTVQSGDSLSTIAAQTGVDVQTLVELNPEADPQQLQAGDELQLGP